MKNYLLGVSAFTNADLLEKCINSWSTIPKDIVKGIFFDGKNWREEFKNLIENGFEKIKNNINFILTLDDHVGVSSAWNEILKYAFVTKNFNIAIIVGSDIEFKEGYVESYIKEFEENNLEFSTARGFGFNCFAMTKKCYETVGEFDLNYYVAYYEDNDFHRRVKLSGLKDGDIGNPGLITHWGSATIRRDKKYENANCQTFPMNQQYFIEKWGGMHDAPNLWGTPFNNPKLTIKDWILDKEKYKIIEKSFLDGYKNNPNDKLPYLSVIVRNIAALVLVSNHFNLAKNLLKKSDIE